MWSSQLVAYNVIYRNYSILSVQLSCYIVNKLLSRYNYTGTQFFDIKRYRSLSWLMETAKEMIRMSLPIKCLEAFVISLYPTISMRCTVYSNFLSVPRYLTSPLHQVQRFAISFKSICNNRVHRHVVMGIYHANQFGALGLSRKKDLMDKSLEAKVLRQCDILMMLLECVVV